MLNRVGFAACLLLACTDQDPATPEADAAAEDAGGDCREGELAAHQCYSGPAGTEGIGQCLAGLNLECRGGYWVCTDEVRPAEEVCDQLDNDCDGQVDENAHREFCDYRDNDCDGQVDEDVRNPCGNCEVCVPPGDLLQPLVRCGPSDGDAGPDSADAGLSESCDLPPSVCDGQWLVYWTDGTCVEGMCQWEQNQTYCDDGCVDGGCEESFT